MRVPLVIVTLAVALTIDTINGACLRRVCYFANWAQYGPTPNTKFFADDIDPFLCTHIVYAFAKLNGNKLAPYEWNDESSRGLVGGYEKATNLKKRNPKLKVLLAVGGWSVGSGPFQKVVATVSSRKEFATNAIKFLRSHKFDGLDLDWEFPANRGSPSLDKQRFSLLVAQLRQSFNQEASGSKRLLLSAAVSSSKSIIDSAYEVPSISKNLDFINLMSYDFHGGWESVTGHNSPLYQGKGEKGESARLNVRWAANYWAQLGAPKNKIVIGMALYGRSFTLTSSNNGVGAPATIGSKGPYTGEAGYLAYYEICELIKKRSTTRYLTDQRVPILISGNQWVGYENENSLKEKVKFVEDNGFGGAMMWALTQDDVKGKFCGKGKFPLANAIKKECS